MGTKQKQPAKKLPRNIQKRWRKAATKQADEDAKWDQLEVTEIDQEDGAKPHKIKPSQKYRDALKKVKQASTASITKSKQDIGAIKVQTGVS
ncbi:hypothetical protein BC830DRAFT_1104072 [Chytriomyces sp. MP71]|nr:hypothetical protein BC830DRAFT_1104072 [Chytriomyces sp. MP71]